jgi:primosomal protein N''
MGTNKVVERIRSLLARFSQDEATVRRLVATDARFDALCQEYRGVIELLDAFEAEVEQLTALEAEVKRLRERRAWLEEELLMRIEGHEPH